MNVADAATTAGIAACGALLLVLAAPFLLIADPGTGLSVYYASGTLGVSGVAFLAVLLVVVFLSGKQRRRDPSVIAGVALVAAVALFALAVAWAVAVDVQNLFSFPASASWITWHRWVVVAVAVVVPASAGVYARAVL